MSKRFTPRRSGRGTGNYEFFELALALGPQQIGVVGDNSFEQLYGRSWLLVLDNQDDFLKLYQEVELGVWAPVTASLPTVFDAPLAADVRRITFAFDQSARIVVAYEQAGLIYATRWDSTAAAYVQNVAFAGRDPCLLMDATLTDPRGFDEPYGFLRSRGVEVTFRWIPDGNFYGTSIPDSDIVLFYLTADRTGVRARVQRELYQVANVIFDYPQPIVMDQAIAISARFQLLVSDANGDQLTSMLISDEYYDSLEATFRPDELLGAFVAPDGVRVEAMNYNVLDDDALASTVAPENVAVVSDLYPYALEEELPSTVAPETVVVVQDIYKEVIADDVDATVTPEGMLAVETDIKHVQQEGFNATVTPEAVRVQTV